MGFFSSKESVKKKGNNGNEKEKVHEGLPELPLLPEIPKINQETKKPEGNHALPSFPESSFGDKMNQNTIKEAVIQENPPQETSIPPAPYEPKRSPRRPPPTPKAKGMITPRTIEIPESQPIHSMHEFPDNKAEPLFIRLDTFEKAISGFNEVRLRLTEIETLLRNIREVKTKEERELNNWEDEVETVKARLEQINKEIFEKIK